MKVAIFCLIFAVAMVGCRSGARSGAVQSDIAPAEDAMTVPVEKPIAVVPNTDGTIGLNLIDGRGEMTIRKAERQTVSVEFPVDGFAKLHASIALKEPSQGNLRISTITLPDGKTDGPFGREIDYNLPVTGGKVSLQIGESLMQGDPWAGDFVITVELRK